MFERLSDSWERLGQRERRLLSLLGITGVLCAILYVGFMIQDGLSELDEHNEDTRSVLASLESRREELIEAQSKQNAAVGMIGEEPIALATYLEKVALEVGVQIRNQADKPTTAKGKFHEHQAQITLFDVTLDQLARFLRGIETQSPIVVVSSLKVNRSTLQKEKIDRVEMVVSTFARAPAKKAAAPAAPAGEEATP